MLTKKKKYPRRGKVSFDWIPLYFIKSRTIAGECFALALEMVGYYTVESTTHTLKEPHDTKY